MEYMVLSTVRCLIIILESIIVWRINSLLRYQRKLIQAYFGVQPAIILIRFWTTFE
ncbi:hypothetical protein MXB_2249 [Myxobolus squamalis]|nr:hypothetical protein MXB_2249 [Myxobolus squamalis]